MSEVFITEANSPEHWAAAEELILEYMIATEIEKGSRTIRNMGDLPTSFQAEVVDPRTQYPQPGRVFLAYSSGQAIGVAGLKAHGEEVVELKRLFVRPSERGGIGRLLLKSVHEYAYGSGIGRIILDVMESRDDVIDWYQRTGYVETGRFSVGDVQMVAMERITSPVEDPDSARD
jgi:GNAT superfamily N-acetyltransferase